MRLGDIFKLTKNNSLNGPNNRNFSLLGDPSLKLAFPKYQIKLTEINGTSINNAQDTLKSLSKSKVKGILVDENDNQVNNFNGILDAAFFDKPQEQETLGSDGPKFKYLDRINTLFRGQASITQGAFEFEFVIPKDIDFNVGEGKMNLYAESDNSLLDANGANIDLLIGSSDPLVAIDNNPPQIQAYMEDLEFVNGSIVTNYPLLLVHLSDENGINISQAGIGHEIIAILDDDLTFILNDYFISDVDDFTSGWINFIFEELEAGLHELKIKGWDNFNNSTEVSLNFVVSDETPVLINELKNFPNPFYNETTFSFEHNRAGESLEIELQIINRNGQLIIRKFWTVNNSPAIVQDITWDGRNNLSKKVDE